MNLKIRLPKHDGGLNLPAYELRDTYLRTSTVEDVHTQWIVTGKCSTPIIFPGGRQIHEEAHGEELVILIEFFPKLIVESSIDTYPVVHAVLNQNKSDAGEWAVEIIGWKSEQNPKESK